MQTEWKDPRDGTAWLITVSALGFPDRDVADATRPRVISFHRPGRRPLWTSYPLDPSRERATDQELMDLLDAARRSNGTRPPSARVEPTKRRAGL
jgi:hypothetical protein